MAKSDPSRALPGEDIDLDRVVVDPAYRRRVLERLRAEAARDARPSSAPALHAGHDD